MYRLSIDAVLILHKNICARTGGDPSVRDIGLVESALEAPFASFGGVELYPTLEEKAARLGYSLIGNHGFVDGNKRIGILSLMVFMEINGRVGSLTDSDVTEAAMGVADGSMELDGLIAWVRKHYV